MRMLAIAVLALAVAVPALARFCEAPGDWSSADRARFLKDMRAAARRVADGAARARKDSARVRSEVRLAAEEMRREVRQLSLDRRERARQWRTEMSVAMREFKQSLKSKSWRDRNRI